MTLLGVLGYSADSGLYMPYFMARFIIRGGMLGCLLAGFVLSLLAIMTGRSARVAFQKARSFYILAGLGLIVSGLGLAITFFQLLRRVLWRLGVSA